MNKEVQVRQQVVGENSHLYVFKKNLNFVFLAVIVLSSILSLFIPTDAIYFGYLAIAFNITYLAYVIVFHQMHKKFDTSKFINYLFKAGKEVKELKGDIRKTTASNNIISNLYMSKSAWTQHGVIVGASGSGKTVFVNAIQKQLLNSGAGFLFLDGKGSNSMLKQVYGLALSHGRENDFMLINFGEKETLEDSSTNTIASSGPGKLVRHSHRYNPMAILDKDSMQDILGDMIDTSGDNAEWAEKAVILGNAVGETLIVLRDLDLLIKPEDTIEIYTYEQLKNSEKKVILTFDLFKEYLSSLINNIALTVMVDRLNVNDEFRKMVYEAFQIRDLKQRLADAIRSMARVDYTRQLKDKLLFIDDWTEFMDTANKELSKKNDAEYTHDVAKDYWNKIFSIFSAYTDVLDTPFSEIDFKDVVMNQKILYVTLPGLKNKVTTSILAKIVINSIKSVAVQKWKEYQITHPFTCFLDEANVWGEDEDDLIIQIGQMYRQTREAGITLCVMHQDNLGEKMNSIYGSANNVFALRVLDKDLAEHLEAFFGEVEIAEFAVTDSGMETNRNAKKDSQRREAKMEKEPLAKKGDFSVLDSGEGFCAIKGVGRMKFSTEFNMPIMFEPKEKRITNIPLPELMPKKIFLKNFFTIAYPNGIADNKTKKEEIKEIPTKSEDLEKVIPDVDKKIDTVITDTSANENDDFDDLLNFDDMEDKLKETPEEKIAKEEKDKAQKETSKKEESLIPTMETKMEDDDFDDLLNFDDMEDKLKETPEEKIAKEEKDKKKKEESTQDKVVETNSFENLMNFDDFETPIVDSKNENIKEEETFIPSSSSIVNKDIDPQSVLKNSNYLDIAEDTQIMKTTHNPIDMNFLDISPKRQQESSFIPESTSSIPEFIPEFIPEPQRIKPQIDSDINLNLTQDIKSSDSLNLDVTLDFGDKNNSNKLKTFDDNINFDIPNTSSKSDIPIFDPLNLNDPFKEDK